MRKLILLVGYLCFLPYGIQLHAQAWAPASLLQENSNPKIYLEYATELVTNRSHLIWTERKDKIRGNETIYYATIENGQLQILRSLIQAPPLIQNISMAFVSPDSILLIWGSNATVPGHPLRSYRLNYGVIRFGEDLNTKNTLAQSVDSTHFISTFQIRLAPSGRILTYWKTWRESVWIREQVEGKWKEAYMPFPERVSPNGSAVHPDIQLTADGLQHLAFIGDIPGVAKVLYPVNFIWYAAKHESASVWPAPTLVYKDTTQATYYPTLRLDSRGVRHIIWFQDSDVDLWPENLFYAYSEDGETWSQAIDLTQNGLRANIIYKDVVVDCHDRLHLVWEQQSFDFQPQTLFYIVGREENWSQPVEILPEQQEGARVDPTLALDSNDRLHLVWEEVLAPLGTRYQLLYSWLDLSTAVHSENGSTGLPEAFTLVATPNPFRTATTIHLQMLSPAQVSVQIINVLGQTVRAFALGQKHSGSYDLHWDGQDENNLAVPAGVYFARAYFQNPTQNWYRSAKLVLLR